MNIEFDNALVAFFFLQVTRRVKLVQGPGGKQKLAGNTATYCAWVDARSASCHYLARSGVTIFCFKRPAAVAHSLILSEHAFGERRADEPHAKMM
jgi:hypothetical protein